MSIVTDVIVPVAAVAGGFGTSYLTNRRSTKTEAAKTRIDEGGLELDSRRVAGEAFIAARASYKEMVADVRGELDLVRKDLATERQGRAEDNRRYTAEINDLRALVTQLRTELDVTRAQLRIPGITTEEGDAR